jgi:hypothetical protein
MHRTRLAYNLRAHYRRIIAVSILIILTLYFQLFRRQQSRDESSIRPIELSRFSLDGLSGGTSSINFVVSATASENTQWLASHFPNATTALYIVDSTDSYSPFKTPANKGNEAMVYLTYIIDHYHKLPEIAVFFHGHLQSKHTDDLLSNSMVETLQRLRLQKVRRDGYFNLRCNWKPGGCPQYLNLRNPSRSTLNGSSQADLLKRTWQELFPHDGEWPEWVGQTYGAQFAASRDSIRRVPLQSWIRWRNWLLTTDLSNYDSGRVWEYTWQYVLAREADFCPSMYRCYCEGFGVCFVDEKAFEEWRKRSEQLDEMWDKYLLMRQGGRKPVVKMRIVEEKKALDRVLREAKDRGYGSGR